MAPDVSLVIVSWNVSELLRKCLYSLFHSTQRISFEVFVVDNASSDGSADMVAKEFPQVRLIRNKKNRGFAVACNQALRQARGRYWLLLNPDTRMFDESLVRAVHFMDTHPDADIVGGKILSSDGSLQPSVRGFPTLFSVLVQFFKLHHIVSEKKILRKYLAINFDYEKTQVVDQVMGAFFFMRPSVGLLDEEYFLWFEEVDLCRRAKKVYYTPEFSVTHEQGKSFAKMSFLKKQWYFYRSALTYFQKERVRTMGFDPLGKWARRTFLILLFVELTSWIAYGNTWLQGPAFFLIVASTFFISLFRLSWGCYIVLAELVVGSFGRLFVWQGVPLRMGIFLALLLGTLVWVICDRKIQFFHLESKRYFLALIFFVFFGVFLGIFHGNALKDVFFDANAYFFLALMIPFAQALKNKDSLMRALEVFSGALFWILIKTLFVFFVFSHASLFFYYLDGLYKFIRDTRVGEITRYENGFVRVFFQSHIYAILLGWIFFVLYAIKRQAFLFSFISLLLIFISYSRSFWLGMALVFFVFLLYLWKTHGFIFSLRTTGWFSFFGILVLGFSWILVNVPRTGEYKDARTLLTERTKDVREESAGKSRLALLGPLLQADIASPLLGEGFGTKVTYQSSDPRVRGSYTTYAFEWGYLDMWLKLGMGGLVAYLLFLFFLLRRAWQKRGNPFFLSMGLGVLTLFLIHAFTPYLNHPLGIGWILFVTIFFESYEA